MHVGTFAAPKQDVVVIANFANMQRIGYEIGFPSAGEWYVHFNSDDTRYGGDYDGFGSARVTAAGRHYRIRLLNE
ncbi:MAG: alpha amylase C-terminal domain-containing protein [Verrucomicrobia bacterium]|nr:alpha amylase C-terminal domain-containing protein [Verrucomicrobiota bacterium]